MDKFLEKTDEELVRLYAEGNYEAFDTFLARSQEKLFSYIMFMVGDRNVADDIFQDTFVKAIMAIRDGRYSNVGSAYAWLMRIARNLVLDHFRSRKNALVHNEIVNDEGDIVCDLFDSAAMEQQDSEMQILVDQSRQEIAELIGRLSESQREVIYLHYYRHLAFREIAELTGVSINTALGRMHYAVNNLRRMIGNRSDLYMAV